MRPADAWIDPSQPKAKALITHGHGDHARGGHGAVLATPETLAIMEVRYGQQSGRHCLWRKHPGRRGRRHLCPPATSSASAQIVLEHKGEKVVVSGDYKRRPDPTCPPFVPVPCDVFITEATFGLPVFRHPPTGARSASCLLGSHTFPEPPSGWRVRAGQGAAGDHELRAPRATTSRSSARRDRAPEPALPELGIELGELAPASGATSRDWRAHRVCPPSASSTTAGRGACPTRYGDGLGLDAHPPARPAARRRAAADHLRPCRLGRAHHDHPRARADAKCGSPTAARKRSSTGA